MSSKSILTRIGSKAKLAKLIIAKFPEHDFFIDMFFGAGGIYFHKPPAKDNICNDADGEVFNLFRVLQISSDKLYDAMVRMPVSEHLWKDWETNIPQDPVQRATRFLLYSNFSLTGKGKTLKLLLGSYPKKVILERIETASLLCQNATFTNKDFRELLPKISFSESFLPNHKGRTFIYADPPYLGTINPYGFKFGEKESVELFNVLVESGIRFAMSERDNPFIIEQAEKRGLNVIYITDRRSLEKRDSEILITNYKEKQLSLF